MYPRHAFSNLQTGVTGTPAAQSLSRKIRKPRKWCFLPKTNIAIQAAGPAPLTTQCRNGTCRQQLVICGFRHRPMIEEPL